MSTDKKPLYKHRPIRKAKGFWPPTAGASKPDEKLALVLSHYMSRDTATHFINELSRLPQYQDKSFKMTVELLRKVNDRRNP